jgi:hypothetical protein
MWVLVLASAFPIHSTSQKKNSANFAKKNSPKFAKKVSNITHLRDAPTPIEGYVANVAWGRNLA